MLMGDRCGAHTFPHIKVTNPTATVEHEASTSKIGDDQIFYCNPRGIPTEDAVSICLRIPSLSEKDLPPGRGRRRRGGFHDVILASLKSRTWELPACTLPDRSRRRHCGRMRVR